MGEKEYKTNATEAFERQVGRFPTVFPERKDWYSSSPELLMMGQEISDLRHRVKNIEVGGKRENYLRVVRPHIEAVRESTDGDLLFDQLQQSIKKLLFNFKNLSLRLDNFVDLKNVLANLNEEARSWDNIYLLRSIVVFYDSVKHAYAEDLTEKQGEVIKEAGDIVISKVVDRNKFKEIYKKLRTSGFQIIPELST